MLIFLSDLHLADRHETSSVDIETLLHELRRILTRAYEKGVEQARLVLLGDIFELLKSERWLQGAARPWRESPEAALLVTEVFEAIVATHGAFFAGLRQLVTESQGRLTLQYVPGNHDHEMNTPLGTAARESLRRQLPLGGLGSALFATYLSDLEHRVIAKHGHEWDPANRFRAGYRAIGDVVVIELVARLAFTARRSLSDHHPLLSLLEELDNVRPQSPGVLALWLLAGLAATKDNESMPIGIVEDALRECVDGFEAALRTARFETSIGTAWASVLSTLAQAFTRQELLLRTIQKLSSGTEPQLVSVSQHARFDLKQAALSGNPALFLVSGHTHRSEVVPLALDHGTPIYLNTGTWRRMRSCVSADKIDGEPRFAAWQEECLVSIFSEAEQRRGLPAFEVRNLLRGA